MVLLAQSTKEDYVRADIKKKKKREKKKEKKRVGREKHKHTNYNITIKSPIHGSSHAILCWKGIRKLGSRMNPKGGN